MCGVSLLVGQRSRLGLSCVLKVSMLRADMDLLIVVDSDPLMSDSFAHVHGPASNTIMDRGFVMILLPGGG